MRMRIGLVVTGGVDRSGRERMLPSIVWLDRTARPPSRRARVRASSLSRAVRTRWPGRRSTTSAASTARRLRRDRARRLTRHAALAAGGARRPPARVSRGCRASPPSRPDDGCRCRWWSPSTARVRRVRGHPVRPAAALERQARDCRRAARRRTCHRDDRGDETVGGGPRQRPARRRRADWCRSARVSAGRPAERSAVAAAARGEPEPGQGLSDPAARARTHRVVASRGAPRYCRRRHPRRIGPAPGARARPRRPPHVPRVPADRRAGGFLRGPTCVVSSRHEGGRRRPRSERTGAPTVGTRVGTRRTGRSTATHGGERAVAVPVGDADALADARSRTRMRRAANGWPARASLGAAHDASGRPGSSRGYAEVSRGCLSHQP